MMPKKCLTLLAVLVLVAGVALLPEGLTAQGPRARATQATSERYLALDLTGAYDALTEIYAADAVFHDPTADVFPGVIGAGPVWGAEEIVALQKSWGLAEQTLDIRASFFVGEYAVRRGTLTVRYQNAATRIPIPFVTVHRVRDDRIIERLDFAEYIESFGLGEAFAVNTATTKRVADEYLRAYLDADMEKQASLLAPDVVFQDPTAQVYGPGAGQLFSDREVLLARRAQTFESVIGFGLDVEESFVSNHHAVYMGTTSYTAGGQQYAQPAVFVIEVRDGKVTRHWDFVDYTVGPSGA